MTNSADPDQLADQDIQCLLRQGMSCSYNCSIVSFFFLFFFFFLRGGGDVTALARIFHYIEPIVHRRWAKTEYREKNHLTIRKRAQAYT